MNPELPARLQAHLRKQYLTYRHVLVGSLCMQGFTDSTGDLADALRVLVARGLLTIEVKLTCPEDGNCLWIGPEEEALARLATHSGEHCKECDMDLDEEDVGEHVSFLLTETWRAQLDQERPFEPALYAKAARRAKGAAVIEGLIAGLGKVLIFARQYSARKDLVAISTPAPISPWPESREEFRAKWAALLFPYLNDDDMAEFDADIDRSFPDDEEPEAAPPPPIRIGAHVRCEGEGDKIFEVDDIDRDLAWLVQVEGGVGHEWRAIKLLTRVPRTRTV